MRILAFVDAHGSHAALESIREKASKADIIVCAGDVSIFENELDKLLFQLNKLKKTVLIIPGNHEDKNDLRELSALFGNINCLHGGCFVKEDCLFLGYGGGGFSTDDKQFGNISKKLEKEANRNKGKKIILVTHAPPYNTRLDRVMGEACGSKTIRKFVAEVKPDMVICGHFHENAGKEDRIGKTKLVNPGPYGRIITV